MGKFAVAAATITFGALLVSAPVQALNGQVKKDGKCFMPSHAEGRDLTFGVWTDCAKVAGLRNGIPTGGAPASAASTPANTNRGQNRLPTATSR
jgi:hypothetical protein